MNKTWITIIVATAVAGTGLVGAAQTCGFEQHRAKEQAERDLFKSQYGVYPEGYEKVVIDEVEFWLRLDKEHYDFSNEILKDRSELVWQHRWNNACISHKLFCDRILPDSEWSEIRSRVTLAAAEYEAKNGLEWNSVLIPPERRL